MKYLKLFEAFLTESDLEKFYDIKVKNPVTGNEITVATALSDPENPLYKKLKAKEQNIKDNAYDPYRAEQIEELKAQIEEMNDRLYNIQADINDLNDQDEPDEDRLQELEDEEYNLTAEIETAKQELLDLKG